MAPLAPLATPMMQNLLSDFRIFIDTGYFSVLFDIMSSTVITSNFVGPFTFLIFFSLQEDKDFLPIGLISSICFVFRISVANSGNV